DGVGGGPRRGSARAQGLRDEAEVEELKIPDPAVDELRRAAGGPRGEVGLLDEHAREPTVREVSGNARPRHAAADDDGVEEFLVQAGEPGHCATPIAPRRLAETLTESGSRRRPHRPGARRATERRARAASARSRDRPRA